MFSTMYVPVYYHIEPVKQHIHIISDKYIHVTLQLGAHNLYKE